MRVIHSFFTSHDAQLLWSPDAQNTVPTPVEIQGNPQHVNIFALSFDSLPEISVKLESTRLTVSPYFLFFSFSCSSWFPMSWKTGWGGSI